MDLKQRLKETLTDDELDLLVRGYDLVGDIAVTIIPPDLASHETAIAAAIMASNKHIKVVAKRDGIHEGAYRTIPLTVIGGENRTETMHREYGVRLLLDPARVYFSVRSGTERKRIADLVRPGEDVLVLFSGVAPYPLIIARHSEARSITGIELNPVAHRYAVRNRELNKATRRVHLLCGDGAALLDDIGRTFDRVVMPLPEGGRKYLPAAVSVLRPNGWLHYYDFQPEARFAAAAAAVERACRATDRTVLAASVISCGKKSPGTWRVCVDARIS